MITLTHQMLYATCAKDYKERTFAPYQAVSEITDISLGILALVGAVILTTLQFPYIACAFYATWGLSIPVVGITVVSLVKQLRFWCEIND